jgi:ADP-heptose:LPS heptosyltransferase
MPESSPSVLIIRLDAIGDALALTPLIAGLRAQRIPVDVLLQASNADIFSEHGVRAIVARDVRLRSSARANRDAVERLGRSLQRNNYSHVLVATEDPAGYRLAAAIGAPVRIGFADPWGKPLKNLWSRRFLTDRIYRSAGMDRRAPHECEVLFRLGTSLLGDAAPTRELDQLRPLVIEPEPAPEDRIAVQITEKWCRIGIGVDEVVQLVRRLASGGALHLLSARREATYAARIEEATRIPVNSFAALAPWKAAIAAATAIVAPDSGALHVAGMIGTPVVAIFPAGRTYGLQVARWAPWAAPHRIVRGDDGWPSRAAEALTQLLAL